MIIEIEAKFNSKDSAFNAFNKINQTLDNIEKADLVTKKTLHNYIEGHRTSKMKKGLLKFSILGALFGLIIGAGIDLFINSGISNIPQADGYTFVFLGFGMITGLMCSILIYFILREEVVPLSDYDLKNREATVVVSIQKRLLPRIRRILFNNGAKSITTV